MRLPTLMTFLAACGLAAAAAPPPPGPVFGNAVQLAGATNHQVALQGNLDGDKIPDEVYFVKVTGRVPANVTVLSPMTSGPKGSPAMGELVVAVVLHPGGKSKPYLLRAWGFDSPTWKQGDYRKLIQLGQGPQPPKDAKGKSIGLFTESGAIYYFYWNGKTFVGSAEGDMP